MAYNIDKIFLKLLANTPYNSHGCLLALFRYFFGCNHHYNSTEETAFKFHIMHCITKAP